MVFVVMILLAIIAGLATVVVWQAAIIHEMKERDILRKAAARAK